MKEIKELPTWVKVAGILTIAYVVIVELPGLWETLTWTWKGIRSACLATVLFGMVQLIFAVAGLSIWLLSVYLSGLGFMNTKRRAYAFLLAYLLLCTVTAPLSYASRRISYAYRQHQIQHASAEQQVEIIRQPVAVMTQNLYLPIGPMLLLLAIWFMCKADNIRIPDYFLRRTVDPNGETCGGDGILRLSRKRRVIVIGTVLLLLIVLCLLSYLALEQMSQRNVHSTPIIIKGTPDPLWSYSSQLQPPPSAAPTNILIFAPPSNSPPK